MQGVGAGAHEESFDAQVFALNSGRRSSRSASVGDRFPRWWWRGNPVVGQEHQDFAAVPRPTLRGSGGNCAPFAGSADCPARHDFIPCGCGDVAARGVVPGRGKVRVAWRMRDHEEHRLLGERRVDTIDSPRSRGQRPRMVPGGNCHLPRDFFTSEALPSVITA